MLRIESLERELVIDKDECIILNEKCGISITKRNISVSDNKHLNAKIDSLNKSIDVLEANEKMTQNFCYPLLKAPGLGNKLPKPIASALTKLQNLTFIGDIPNHTY